MDLAVQGSSVSVPKRPRALGKECGAADTLIVICPRLSGLERESRLPGGDGGKAKVQWTFAPKNAGPVGGPGGRRG